MAPGGWEIVVGLFAVILFCYLLIRYIDRVEKWMFSITPERKQRRRQVVTEIIQAYKVLDPDIEAQFEAWGNKLIRDIKEIFNLKYGVKREKYIATINHELDLLREQNRIEIKDIKAKSRDMFQSFTSKLVAEADQIFADASLKETQRDLLKKLVVELKIDNITIEQYALLIKLIDPKASLDIDPIAGKKIIEEQLERMKQETARAKEQVKQEAAKSIIAELDARIAKDDYKNR